LEQDGCLDDTNDGSATLVGYWLDILLHEVSLAFNRAQRIIRDPADPSLRTQ
jgi:hypothetical protein